MRDTKMQQPSSTSTQMIYQKVVNFFSQDEWSFTSNNEDKAILMSFQGENGTWNCYAQVNEEQLIFYSIYPRIAEGRQRSSVAEFITRANSGIVSGNFEMDYEDGTIRYKTGIDIDGEELTLDIIMRLVYTNVVMMDKYLPGLIAVMEEEKFPIEAIAKIEEATSTSKTSSI